MKILRNILAIILGLGAGMLVNGLLIKSGPHIIPPPDGADFTTTEGLKASMHLMQPEHFIFPFLAHALGTLAGAIIAGLTAATRKMTFAMVIGCLFLVAGIINIVMLPSPWWFTLVDLVLAYLPMGYIGGILTRRRSGH